MDLNIILNRRDNRRGLNRCLPAVRVIAALTVIAGCAGERPRATLPEAPPPLTARPVLKPALNPCEAPNGAIKDAPADMVVFYVGSGRNFDEAAGPDGYVLRVAFLNDVYQVVKMERGMLEVYLLTSPGEEPWMLWEADARDLAGMWIPSRLLDGYMLRLAWGKTPPSRGDYMFRVYYYPDGADAPAAYCRSVFCQDYELRAAELPAAEMTDAPQ